MINLQDKLGPALQPARGVVDVNGVGPVRSLASAGVVNLQISFYFTYLRTYLEKIHLRLPVLESRQALPSRPCLDAPLAEEGRGRELARAHQVTDQVHLGHPPGIIPGLCSEECGPKRKGKKSFPI